MVDLGDALGLPPMASKDELLQAAAVEITRLRAQLAWRADNRGATHYPGCWREHQPCAVARIEAFEAAAIRQAARGE